MYKWPIHDIHLRSKNPCAILLLPNHFNGFHDSQLSCSPQLLLDEFRMKQSFFIVELEVKKHSLGLQEYIIYTVYQE